MKIHTLTIVGTGLIGGSIGLAVRQRNLAEHIIGAGRSGKRLEAAKAAGAIDEVVTVLSNAVREADLVVFCTPVDIIAKQVRKVAPHCREGTLLTDAGSTKTTIVNDVGEYLPDGVHFVGSHPLAGSEKQGVDNAQADLFEDRVCVVTPAEHTDAGALEAIRDFWQSLGMQVREMSPEEHDRKLALTSHVPHMVAAALAGLLPEDDFDLAATGFRDTTRIAAGDPALWSAILRHNRKAVLQALDLLSKQLGDFRKSLQKDDEIVLEVMLAEGKKIRDALGN